MVVGTRAARMRPESSILGFQSPASAPAALAPRAAKPPLPANHFDEIASSHCYRRTSIARELGLGLGRLHQGNTSSGIGSSIGGRRSDFFTARKLAPGNLGLLQQYLPQPDSCTAAKGCLNAAPFTARRGFTPHLGCLRRGTKGSGRR
jgi:hypothetical protein